MHHPRTVSALAAIAAVALGACGDPAAEPVATEPVPVATKPVPAATAAPTTPPDDHGGSGLPAAAPGEFPVPYTVRMAGELELDDRGCWFLDASYGRGLLVFPPGFELAESGTDVVPADGTPVAAGQAIDVTGTIVHDVAELPGGIDGKWANHASFCGRADGVVVSTELAAAFLPTPEDAATLVAELGGAALTVDWPCGYGFATSSPDERIGLTITPNTEPPSAGAVSLPDERFDAVVTVGSNLFANNCDDVVEWFEPNREEAARFEIVSGEFTYPGAGDGMCSGGGPSVITVTDLVVALPTGDIALDPIEIVNDAPGCFAG